MENWVHSNAYGIPSRGTDTAAAGVARNVPSPTIASPTFVMADGTLSSVPQGSFHGFGNSGGVIRPAGSVDTSDLSVPAKRPRKERGPNWSSAEVAALVEAKRCMFLDELETEDRRDLMVPDAGKWIQISNEVMRAQLSPCVRDGPAYKSKWNQLIPEYKKIADFLAGTDVNDMTYWNITTVARKAEGLPRTFPQDLFFLIHDWYGTRPAIVPPHSRDLMSGDDCNYKTLVPFCEDNVQDVEGSDGDDDDPLVVLNCMEDTDGATASTKIPLTQLESAKARALLGLPPFSVNGSPNTVPKGSLPPSITPHLLSSSNTSDATARRCAGNTGVRRKNISGHSLIAEATRATGDAMVGQMRQMAEASQELEKTKIDVQQRLFSQQMEYQKDRDLLLHESSRLANENAKLAIEKQSEVVQCLAQLSAALTAGAQRSHSPQTEAAAVRHGNFAGVHSGHLGAWRGPDADSSRCPFDETL